MWCRPAALWGCTITAVGAKVSFSLSLSLSFSLSLSVSLQQGCQGKARVRSVCALVAWAVATNLNRCMLFRGGGILDLVASDQDSGLRVED